MASIYHVSKGDRFEVKSGGDLGFSVGVFCCVAVIGIIIMYLKRKLHGGELGGPKFWKRMSTIAYVFLWILFIGISSMKIHGHI